MNTSFIVSLVRLCAQEIATFFVIVLLLVLLWISRRRGTIWRESWYIYNKLCDVHHVSAADRAIITRVLKHVSIAQPHVFISSLSFFDEYFMNLMIAVDRSKKLYPLKTDLLRIYAHIRKELIYEYCAGIERRAMPRARQDESVYFKKANRKEVQQGVLKNISGGGVSFTTRYPVKKGMSIQINFENNFITSVTARVLDVIKKTDNFIVRAKYSLAYPK